MSESTDPVLGTHGSTRNVVGSGTKIESGPPVNAAMPRPAPEANIGANRLLVVSMNSVAV